MHRITIITFLLFTHSLIAQNIPTKGSLGVQVAPAPENDKGGIHAVHTVFPNTTAENLGMKPKDILLELNGIKLITGEKIGQAVDQLIAGNNTTALVLRDGNTVELTGKIMPRQPLKKPNHELKLLEVQFREGYVRAYLTYPKSEGPFPTIYFIQGYPCHTINGHPLDPTLQLTNHLVDLGYAVFRIEKPGIGEYVNLQPCIENSFDDEVENFSNGLTFLKEQNLVDKDKIYLFGHSLGGTVAPLIAEESEVAGVMVYGTMIKPWNDYLVDLTLYSQAYSEDVTGVMNQLHILKSAIRKLYENDVAHQDLTTTEKALIEKWHGYSEKDDMIFTRKVDFWKNFSKHNFLKSWLNTKTPVLGLYGEYDVHAIGPLDTELLVHAINEKHPNQASFKIVEGTNHVFAEVPSRMKELEYINTGMAAQIAITKFNKELPTIIDEWINADTVTAKTHAYRIESTLFPQAKTSMSSMDAVTHDFNGDGHGDLVIATEFGPNQIFLYESGKWVPGATLPQLRNYSPPVNGEDSEDIGIGDFNRDGHMDLVFVSEDTENHELLLNDGKAQFDYMEFQIPKTGQANAVLVHDFNQDGWDDVLLGIRGQNELYLNDKGKTFYLDKNSLWPINSDHTQDIIAIDIDGDDDLDIVEGIEEGSNNLYLNDEGKFIEVSERLPLPNNIETRKVISLDYDGDGDQDLFYCNVGWNPQKNPNNQLLENDGKGNFINVSDRLPDDQSTTLDAVFLDINEDGKKDIITSNFINDKKVQVYVSEIFEGKVKYKRADHLLPELSFTGGISLLPIEVESKKYLYFGNFNSTDILLQQSN